MLRTDDLNYDLPESSIATAPATPRDSARLLVVPNEPHADPDHRTVRDLPGLLRPGDLLVFNATRVLRARFEGRRADTGGRMEGLFLSEEPRPNGLPGWVCLVRIKKLRPGMVLSVERTPGVPLLHLAAVEPRPDEPGAWLLEPRRPDGAPATGPAAGVLEEIGLTPLPPYILKAREHAGLATDDRTDHDRYQTVFARTAGDAAAGSVAAPTAGLHFTPELLAALEAKGVRRAEVVLHVGTGTFRTVETEFVEQHPMHTEWCSIAPEAVDAVLAAKREGRRVFAVGTTSARTLESYAQAMEGGSAAPASLATKILITPGYRWRWVDGLFTNFHLPKSTLMAMVAARLSDQPGVGVARLKSLYAGALAAGYRFYSFGDAMLIGSTP